MKRKHKDTTRLTAKERAREYLTHWGVPATGGMDQENHLTRVIAAAVKQALARRERRATIKRLVAHAARLEEARRAKVESFVLKRAGDKKWIKRDRRAKGGR